MSIRVAARPKPFASNLTAFKTISAKPSSPTLGRTSDYTPNEDAASSIYTVPDSEAINTVLDQQATQCIDKSDTAHTNPHPLQRRQPMRIITRRGKVLCADGMFRGEDGSTEMPKRLVRKSSPVSPRAYGGYQGSGSGTFKTYAARMPNRDTGPARPEGDNHMGPTIRQALPEPDELRSGKRQVNHRRDRSISPKSPVAFPEQHTTEPRLLRFITAQELFEDPTTKVPASRFVVSDHKLHGQPTRRRSLVRRLSNSVKSRLSRTDDGKVLESRGGEPKENAQRGKEDELKRPDSNIRTATHRLRPPLIPNIQDRNLERTPGSAMNMRRPPVLRVAEANDKVRDSPTQRHATFGLHSTHAEVPAMPSAIPRQLHACKHTANKDLSRQTRWSDFIAQLGHPSTNEADLRKTAGYMSVTLSPLPAPIHNGTSVGQTHHVHHVPDSAAPFPVSQPSSWAEARRKRVDVSRKSWMPPDRKRGVAGQCPSSPRLISPLHMTPAAFTNHSRNFGLEPSFPVLDIDIDDLFPPDPDVEPNDVIDEILDSYASLDYDPPLPHHPTPRVVRSQYRRCRLEQRRARREIGSDEIVGMREELKRLREGGMSVRERRNGGWDWR